MVSAMTTALSQHLIFAERKTIPTVLQYCCLPSTFLKDTKLVKYIINKYLIMLVGLGFIFQNVNIDLLINVCVHCAALLVVLNMYVVDLFDLYNMHFAKYYIQDYLDVDMFFLHSKINISVTMNSSCRPTYTYKHWKSGEIEYHG